jgi:DNA-nicking Smr family endonuclease
MKNMFPTLDLHGIKHEDVESVVEEFICMNEGTVKIITGYSHQMKIHVNKVLKKYNMQSRPERLINQGALIVY